MAGLLGREKTVVVALERVGTGRIVSAFRAQRFTSMTLVELSREKGATIRKITRSHNPYFQEGGIRCPNNPRVAKIRTMRMAA